MNLLNALPAVSIRRLVPRSGAWLADVDVELDASQVPPVGPCVLTIGASTLKGTIDPDASGFIASKFRARVIGGGGGWHTKPLLSQAYHSDGGVLSTIPISATATSVGEVAVVATPANLGTDFVVSSALPASQVFRGQDWHVDALGITQVGPRLPIPIVDPTVQVLDYDGLTQSATVAADILLEPGMVLTDPRFGVLSISQVEQTFGASETRATVWCSASGAPRGLGDAMAKLARAAVGLTSLRTYKYRVVAQSGDGRLVLQAVNKAAGIPDQLPITPWFGVAGCSAKLTPGALVVLEFAEGDPGQPMVVAFDATQALEVDINGLIVKLGATAQTGVATLTTMTPLMVLIQTLCTTLSSFFTAASNPGLASSGVDPNSLAPAIAAAATALGAGAVLPVNFSTTVSAAP